MQIPDARVSELWTPSARSFKATAGSRPPVRAPSCSDVWLLKPALPVRFVPNGSVIGQPGIFDRVFQRRRQLDRASGYAATRRSGLREARVLDPLDGEHDDDRVAHLGLLDT
jgi:hypothetical protein